VWLCPLELWPLVPVPGDRWIWSIEHCWNGNGQGKTNVLGEKPDPVPFSPAQISCSLCRDWIWTSYEKPMANSLICGTDINWSAFPKLPVSLLPKASHSEFCYCFFHLSNMWAGIAQSVSQLATGWMTKVSEFESWWDQEFLLLLVIQTGSGVHPTSYPMGTGGSFPGVKRPGREADHWPPASAEVKKSWVYQSTPLYAFMA
jgi:hypothetical protein